LENVPVSFVIVPQTCVMLAE